MALFRYALREGGRGGGGEGMGLRRGISGYDGNSLSFHSLSWPRTQLHYG